MVDVASRSRTSSPWSARLVGQVLTATGLLAVLSALPIARAQYRPQASAVLLAMMAFAILRLPTGNIWDALLDPLLWAWAFITLAGNSWRRILGRRGKLPQAA